ncbi:hypothetical protein EDM00_08745 [Ornithobacterium rhinotracheale]|uniref:lipocalin family protein n=1 Tax=Ornithobacterium rhinotracheale TaxID=28251 RepID=UPI00129D19B7|nr:lipocalin family protein [Ornithobacterium rhinotracheale]MRI64074.1 hypothetical protein [Ornithobacterium rhinotracheale]
MKKVQFLSLVLVALSAILFISCNKDDDGGNPNVQKNEIYGEWELYYEYDAHNKQDREFKKGCGEIFNFYKNKKLTFLPKYNNCEVGELEEGTFEISGNKIIITDDKGVSNSVEILRLDDKFLDLKFEGIADEGTPYEKKTFTTSKYRKIR